MTYQVKEIYYTLQGEGVQTGRASVFLRFAGCNLWSGREADRSAAVCPFCDTDFVGTDGPRGGRYETESALAKAVRDVWEEEAPASAEPYVVCTGGEPLLQLGAALVDALHDGAFSVAVETNGTIAVPSTVDWICVSPKAGTRLVQRSGQELKLVFPQADLDPESFAELDFAYFSLQPMDGPDLEDNIRRASDYCRDHPDWQLSLQVHKLMGIP